LRSWPLRRVAVEPPDVCERVARAQRGLDLLGPHAEGLQGRGTAVRTCRGSAACVTTMVTDDRAGATMPAEGHAAVRAAHRRAAPGALEIDGEAAAVQKDECLAARAEIRVDGGAQASGEEARGVAIRRAPAQVDDLDRRERVRRRPLGQLEEHVST